LGSRHPNCIDPQGYYDEQVRVKWPIPTTLLIAVNLVASPYRSFSQTLPGDAPVAAAGYQAIDDCNENNIPDDQEAGSGRFFSIPLLGLRGPYGGYVGQAHSTAFQFDDDFLIIRHAWLRLAGTADSGFSSSYPVDLDFRVYLNSAPWDEAIFPDLDQYEVCIPLAPPALNGTISLLILIGACCDHISFVASASLWLDAVPMPPPQTLEDFAEFQNCVGTNPQGQGCDASDLDWDADTDLADLGYLVQFLSDP
jgi:hypothetical protein